MPELTPDEEATEIEETTARFYRSRSLGNIAVTATDAEGAGAGPSRRPRDSGTWALPHRS